MEVLVKATPVQVAPSFVESHAAHAPEFACPEAALVFGEEVFKFVQPRAEFGRRLEMGHQSTFDGQDSLVQFVGEWDERRIELGAGAFDDFVEGFFAR